MKNIKLLVKLAAAAAAIAGIAYLVVKYLDKIKAWVQKICPCCTLEDDFAEDAAFEPAAEEAPVEVEVEAESAPAVEEAPVDDTVPVADDADFEA